MAGTREGLATLGVAPERTHVELSTASSRLAEKPSRVLRASARGLARSWPVARGVQRPASKTRHMVALVVEGGAMTAAFEAKRSAACDGVLRGLRRRLAGLEGWTDGPVKAVAREALREEMARLGRELVELEWGWA